MIAQGQPQYILLPAIIYVAMQSTDDDNIELPEEVGSDPVTWKALTTPIMYDPTTEFPQLFPEEKPTKLHALRDPMAIIQLRIDITPHSYY